MKPERPVISIITVVFNGEEHIIPTVESVLNQTFTNYEYLIIDGKSTDTTLDILSTYKSGISKLISEKDDGVYDGMNKGLAAAQGDYILFLNAGDELASSRTLESIFKEATDADLFYGETLILNQDREVLGTRTELTSRKLPEDLKKNDFLKGQVVGHQSFIPRRSLCAAYDLKYSCSADIDWMLNVLEKGKKYKRTPIPISKYLQGGISDRSLKKCWWERFLILTKHFNTMRVCIMHITFAIRYLLIGAYRNTKKT